MSKDKDPVDLKKIKDGIARDAKAVDKAGRSGDPVVDDLKRLFDQRTKGK